MKKISVSWNKDIPLVKIEKLANKHLSFLQKVLSNCGKNIEKYRENILLHARCDKNNSKFDIAIGELLRFLGVILLSGYHTLPSEQDFWLNQPDLDVPIVSEALSSKRFLQIKFKKKKKVLKS